MPNRIPTPGIKTPAVRTSKSAQPSAKPSAKPASKMESAKRPAVGADVDAKKKYGSKSWNNGYTN